MHTVIVHMKEEIYKKIHKKGRGYKQGITKKDKRNTRLDE